MFLDAGIVWLLKNCFRTSAQSLDGEDRWS
jgi:hypothetical protein